MDQEKLEDLHKRAGIHIEVIGKVVRGTISPQIQGFNKDYDDYLKELRISSGVMAGAVVALLSSDIIKIESLAILGLSFLVIVVFLTFRSTRKAILSSIPLIQFLKKQNRWLVDFSNNATRFSRGEIAPNEFKEIEKEFRSNYNKWRNNQLWDEFNLSEERYLLRMDKWYSSFSIIFYIFVLGLTLTTASLIIPYFC